ncbi:MAG: uncharacterized protein JWN85_3717 [Gammaproteobacteria bacterium]|nr:uncharacterized protein [Gammaproteobacteria bacterium]
MRFILFTLMSIVCTAAIAGTVYKWVDEDGVTHYSDQPHENAQKVQLAAPQTYAAPRPPARPRPPSSRDSSPQPAAPYQSCALLSPVNEQTLPTALSVPASVRLDPQQRAGDQVFLLLDGARMPGLPTSGDSFTISPIERGTHTLQAVVLDSNGQLVCQSAPVTFNVLQPSLLNPASPLRRH